MNTRTATEVRESHRQMEKIMAPLQDAMVKQSNDFLAASVCLLTNGFFVIENKSPKKLARLKHSITQKTLKSI